MKTHRLSVAGLALAGLVVVSAVSCGDAGPEGLASATPAATRVRLDFFHKPLPDLPLPNDLATRYDASSATGRRVNASMIATTGFESHVRKKIDELDGWGTFQSISIPFDGRPLDVQSILDGHRDADFDFSNDVVYLVNVDRKSKRFGELHPIDLGGGSYPVVLQVRDNYWKNDPRVDTMSLFFEETWEDKNGNGVLDPGEDTDADGVLDKPNYLPGKNPAPGDLGGRADALMTFYERETNTLLLRPMTPLDERTTYAVVITRRLKDVNGEPVGSPYPFINHAAQTEALAPLPEVLPKGLALSDVAFAFTFTTQSVASHMVAVRDGLYGKGVQAHIGKEFPAEVDSVEPMRDADAFPNAKMLHLMYGEDWLKAVPTVLTTLLGQDAKSVAYEKTLASYENIDYFVVGSFLSPQLFPREDADKKLLPYDDQSWPADLDRVKAPARSETVYFTLAVPRKEISARKDGKPAPVVVVGHGYGSSRFEGMQFAGFLAQHGLASIAIDCPSHGIDISETQKTLATGMLGAYGLASAGQAVFKDRAFDQNGDGAKDSGADFWSAYLFHTRDMVRQSALDYMQLIRILTAFDGKARWKLDVNGDGKPELAGDFDADGAVDVGGDAPLYMIGGSLGGIMSMLMGGVEPKLTGIAPISGGAGLSDIGIRSKQGGVPEAFILRSFGPIFTGTLDAAAGTMRMEQIVPDLNNVVTVPIADVTGVGPGDAMIVENLHNHERGCGYVTPEGKVRATVASDVHDELRIHFYRGVQFAGTKCELPEGAPAPSATVDTWQIDGEFQSQPVTTGEPLYALAEGLGLRRANPEFRRFQGIGQLVIDPGDAANFARNLLDEPLTYATGEKTGAHAIVISTMGDMSVPVSSGITFGRAAGLIEYRKVDPRYGKPVNQELIDDHTAEAAYNLKRYTDPQGNAVHLDIENFSQGTDMWGTSIPRKEKPYRLGFDGLDKLGGKSAAIFPYTVPEGQHGFAMPGEMTDSARKACRDACTQPGPGDDPCGCNAQPAFDIGLFMFNMVGRWMASGSTYLAADLCQSADDCTGQPFAWPTTRPAQRDPATLP